MVVVVVQHYNIRNALEDVLLLDNCIDLGFPFDCAYQLEVICLQELL